MTGVLLREYFMSAQEEEISCSSVLLSHARDCALCGLERARHLILFAAWTATSCVHVSRQAAEGALLPHGHSL